MFPRYLALVCMFSASVLLNAPLLELNLPAATDQPPHALLITALALLSLPVPALLHVWFDPRRDNP